jgi:DNA-binding transcriptional regulator YiaG
MVKGMAGLAQNGRWPYIETMMTPEQFKRALDELELTQPTAAALLGVHPRTTRRWANAEREIPMPVRNFLWYLIGKRADPNDAMRVVKRVAGRVG